MLSHNKYIIILLLYSTFSIYSQQGSQYPTLYKEKFSKPLIQKKCITPDASIQIGHDIPEGSGLISWDDHLWTHNDSGEAIIYKMDAVTGVVMDEYKLPLKNNDWEDMDQDENFIYIGDFGNNAGKKNTLHIYRVDKKSLLNKTPVVDSISFVWPVIRTKNNKKRINFDCEAMAVIGDTIYLFTKEWKKDRGTKAFTLPAAPGIHTASYRSTLKTNILITGATYDERRQRLVLCGYTLLLSPRLLIFPNTKPSDIFAGPADKIKIKLPFCQVEAVSTFDGLHYYIINEKSKFLFLENGQQLHKITLKN